MLIISTMMIRVVIALMIMRDMMRMMTCQSEGGVDWSRRGRNQCGSV